MSNTALNAGQQAAADGFFNFLFSEKTELCISGSGGVGKTYLMGYLIDKIIPKYLDSCTLLGMDPIYQEVHMTATTNKAAAVLGDAVRRPTQTIQSLLKLKVVNDHRSGRTKLVKGRDWIPVHKKIIFVDEASLIDTPLREFILASTQGCKVVYVGDHCQLAPVGEKISPIYTDNLPFFELTQPVRNCGQPALMAACQQLRETVETGRFRPIRIVPGVIDHLGPQEMEEETRHLFAVPSDKDRILCYTNNKVRRLNDHIRSMRGMPQELVEGEYVVNNSTIKRSDMTLRAEEEFRVVAVQEKVYLPVARDEFLEVVYCTLEGEHGVFSRVPVPVNQDHFNKLVSSYYKQQEFKTYFELKDGYPDLRPRDAATVYKAQGSTYDTVVVDLDDISSCHDPNTVARMFYVAFSRAKNRVVLFGRLADKYGGIVR